jgi:hypothetical protein
VGDKDATACAHTTECETMSRLTQFNENLYSFTVMGTPSDTDPWGFQRDGHHLAGMTAAQRLAANRPPCAGRAHCAAHGTPPARCRQADPCC